MKVMQCKLDETWISFLFLIFDLPYFIIDRHPPVNKVKSDIEITLTIPKDVSVDLHMQIFIGYENSWVEWKILALFQTRVFVK